MTVPRRAPDLRTLLLAAFGWAGALTGAGRGLVLPLVVGLAIAALAGLLAVRLRRGASFAVLAGLVVYLAVATSAGVHYRRVTHNVLAQLARSRAEASLTGTVVDDPRRLHARFGDEALVRLQVRRADAGGRGFALRQPVLVFGSTAWLTVPLGSTVSATGHLGAASRPDAAAVLTTSAPPRMRAPPGLWWRASGRLRAALRQSVAGLPPERRVLVPALVDGDDAGLDPALVDDFRTTGLTHLLAVSGTNLTLVVGFAMGVARWLRVRGRWLYVVGAAGTLGFVLVARAEPSVLRAAAMGSVALVGMGANGTSTGTRALGTACVVLLLLDPTLASAAGFVLSVLATAGILLLAPGWRDALAGWLPRWLAEAIAVPAAAQLACTPVVAAISGQVSLVAVVANLLAAPAVGPATILGLVAGLVTLVAPPVGRVVGCAAGWCVAWIVLVAQHAARLPTASVAWGSGAVALAGLALLCVVLAAAAGRLLAHRPTALACGALMAASVLVRLPTPGWPPHGWLMVACDVGQGDGLVLNTGVAHSAVVVDAGPEPVSMDRCLDQLGVRRIPLLVLTHFHADHVDGLPGALDGRQVGTVWVTRLLDPPQGVALVRRATARAGVPVVTAPYGQTRRVGEITLEPVWPRPDSPTVGPGDGSTANAASVVVLARVRGVTFLLTGDIEPDGQAALARELPGLRVDVLKVPHHGSRYQDVPFLQSLHARLAVISVGADNDYGQPSPETLAALSATGERVLRTDRDGTVAVVERAGRLGAVTR